MANVYLDTSVAITEAYLRSPYCEAFLKACALLQHTVVIPEIVLDELRGKFPKKYTEASDAFQKSKKELNKLIDLDPTGRFDDSCPLPICGRPERCKSINWVLAVVGCCHFSGLFAPSPSTAPTI